MAYIVFHKDGTEMLRVQLDRSEMVIGRGEGSHIVLPASDVSRKHCKLVQRDDDWVLVDLESTGGVTVNATPVDGETTLSDGDQIALGSYVAVFHPEPPVAADETKVAPRDPTHILSITGDGKMVVEQAELKVAEGPDAGKTFSLRSAAAVIGKGTACDVVLTDSYVSTSHCRLEYDAGAWRLVDLGSTNGTRVGGMKVGDAEIAPGSRISLGETTLVLETGSAERKLEPVKGDRFQGMIGASAPIKEVFALLQAVAATDAPVLLLGESGTGKELAARAVHAASPRANRKFVAINSGGLSPNLVESEFFGHERGAFTGADRRRLGAFERTGGGTLFLDEIGELPMDLQAKLLRVLETGDFQRVGGNETLHSDARVIAATHRDLQEMVAEGTFREDLFYRLAVVPVRIPPLRERPADIPLLAVHLLEQMTPKGGETPELTPAATTTLQGHGWPGNVRELRNALQRAMLFARGGPIEASHLALNPMRPAATSGAPAGTTMQEVEKNAIVAALRRNDGNRKAAAKDLGIARSTLHEKMKKYSIDIPSKGAKKS